MRELVKVSGKKALAAFVDFPHELYADDVNYVPELLLRSATCLLRANILFTNIPKSSFFCFMMKGG